jgi:hypothetical protein
MMTTRRFGTTLGVAAGLLLLAATAARATNPCIHGAQEAFADCKAQCKEDNQVAKDACFARDHDCVETCREVRGDCVDSSGLGAALMACAGTLRSAKVDCRSNNPPGSAGLDGCIDVAQVTGFLCRKTAWKNAKPALALCRTGFRTCAGACPSTGVVVDRRSCLIDAKNANVGCKGDCREQFQTAKDTCLDHDHACVEQCRADRDACRQPIEDQLDAAIAACNTTRASDIAACNGDDNCILAAKITAFLCRDGARESAKPGFAQCQTDFAACANQCPPPPS